MARKKKTPAIAINDDDSGDEDDGYDTDDSNAGMPKMVKREYDNSDDESDDEEDAVSPQEDDKKTIDIKANSD